MPWFDVAQQHRATTAGGARIRASSPRIAINDFLVSHPVKLGQASALQVTCWRLAPLEERAAEKEYQFNIKNKIRSVSTWGVIGTPYTVAIVGKGNQLKRVKIHDGPKTSADELLIGTMWDGKGEVV